MYRKGTLTHEWGNGNRIEVAAFEPVVPSRQVPQIEFSICINNTHRFWEIPVREFSEVDTLQAWYNEVVASLQREVVAEAGLLAARLKVMGVFTPEIGASVAALQEKASRDIDYALSLWAAERVYGHFDWRLIEAVVWPQSVEKG